MVDIDPQPRQQTSTAQHVGPAPAQPPADPDVRVEWTLKMQALTAFAVGGAVTGAAADLVIARDGLGRPYIPGTSWAGVLRGLALALGMPENTVRSVFGYQEGARSAAPGSGWASRVTVEDTPIGAGDPAELRSGVGIDRVTGAAAERIRYDREVLPAGTALRLRVRYEGDGGDGLAALRKLLSAVRAHGLRVGASTRRGLGRLACAAVTEQVVDLRAREALLGWFCGATDAESLDAEAVRQATLAITVSWRPGRPVIVGSGAPGEQAQLVPLMTRSATANGLVPVLPGASVKGVLRTVAERVTRTVLAPGAGAPAAPALPEPSEDFVPAMDKLCESVPPLEALFGSRRRAGALSVADTAAERPVIGVGDWADYLAGTHAAAGNGDGPAPAAWDRARAHVAIDRWTGGAADQQLFTVQELADVRWPPIQLEVDTSALRQALGHDEPQVRAALVLLGCAVGLLLEGEVGFGHGTGRGLGEVEVTGLGVEAPDAEGLPEFPAFDGDADELRQLWWMWLGDLAPEGRWVPALADAAIKAAAAQAEVAR